MTTENRTRVVTVRRVCVSRSSTLNSRALCRMTDPKNSTSGRCTSSCMLDLISGSGLSGASKLMTSLPATAAVFNIRSVSIASAERCMESRELVLCESRDTALSALFSLTDSSVIASSGAIDPLPTNSHQLRSVANKRPLKSKLNG